MQKRHSPHALDPGCRHAPSYYAATAGEAVSAPPLDVDCSAEVCVIGGGFAGLSTALHLAERGVEVVLLEQSLLGWGASGRNGGQAHVGMRRDQEWLEKRMGPADARRLWELALDARSHLDTLIDTYRISCDFRPGLLHADHKAAYTADTRRHVRHLRDQYGYTPIRFVDRDEVRAMVATADYHSGSFDERGGHLHPLNLALGLARAAA
ncbi:MAG: FAD-binding oxidoreductase, partial [Gammaproteobacteria bacterium]|nr:FAD-binding oxidoreductase [Gammaproteobacteria bacterium]